MIKKLRTRQSAVCTEIKKLSNWKHFYSHSHVMLKTLSSISYLCLFDMNIKLKYWIQHEIVASQVKSYIWVKQPTIWKNSKTFPGQNGKIPRQKKKKNPAWRCEINLSRVNNCDCYTHILRLALTLMAVVI